MQAVNVSFSKNFVYVLNEWSALDECFYDGKQPLRDYLSFSYKFEINSFQLHFTF